MSSYQTLYYKLFYSDNDEFKTFMINRKLSNNNSNNNNNNSNNNSKNDFYNNNNYINFDDYNNNDNTPEELPEWYNNEKDDCIVDEVIDEWNLFYDPTISIDAEIKTEELKYNLKTYLSEESDEGSDDDWTTV